MIVKDVCELNLRTISSDIEFDTYEYLDTGNLTRNKIEEIKVFNNRKDLPSRARRLVKDGDILISTVRPNQQHYGIIENPKENLLVSTGFAVLSPDPELVNKYYLYYFLTQEKTTKYLQKVAESSVSAYPSITPDVIENMMIDLPHIDVQNNIIDSIHIFDKKISANLRFIEELEEYTQVLFYKWFVEFNFPNEEGKAYKKNGGLMKEVDGKTIPAKWEVVPLNKIVNKITTTINPSKEPNKVFKYYSIPVYDDTKTYGNELGSSIKSNKYKVTNKYLLVSKLNPWFKRIVYPLNVKEAICSTEFVVWCPMQDKHLEYLYVLSNTSKFTRYCKIASTGTSNSHKRIDPDFMLKFNIAYNENVIVKFNELIKPIVEKIHLAIAENKALEEARNILINKLIK
jgi:type I restriction enzyme, S subunit